jgi:hypothetical protein
MPSFYRATVGNESYFLLVANTRQSGFKAEKRSRLSTSTSSQPSPGDNPPSAKREGRELWAQGNHVGMGEQELFPILKKVLVRQGFDRNKLAINYLNSWELLVPND